MGAVLLGTPTNGQPVPAIAICCEPIRDYVVYGRFSIPTSAVLTSAAILTSALIDAFLASHAGAGANGSD